MGSSLLTAFILPRKRGRKALLNEVCCGHARFSRLAAEPAEELAEQPLSERFAFLL